MPHHGHHHGEHQTSEETLQHGDLHILHKPGRYPPIKLPPNEPIKTLDSLKVHLQAAMALELSTIPLYLFGMYSVVVTDSTTTRSAIHSVVVEEMLHLALAGNVLRAVGGTPTLYSQDIIPKYPSKMAGRVPDLPFDLRRAIRENISTFVEVETPEPQDAPPEGDEYQTIGQFYKAVEQGLQYLNGTTPGLFVPNLKQFQFPQSAYFPQNDGGLVDVVDLTSSLLALTTIVVQGEGNPRPWDDPEHDTKDHYDIFLEIFNAVTRKYDTYPVVSNPTTELYDKIDPNIGTVSRAFDASYCYLLLTVQYLWQVQDGSDRDNIVNTNLFGLMGGVLTPIANFMVLQPLGTAGQVAAPCFQFFGYQAGPDAALPELKAQIQAAVKAYPNSTELSGALAAVNKLLPVPVPA